MPQQMDEKYFDEKQALACGAINDSFREATDALALINAARYFSANLVEANQVHQTLNFAAHRLRSARRDFEKSRWAAAQTSVEFDQWLQEGPGKDLQ